MLQETEKKNYINLKNVIVLGCNISPSSFSWWQWVIRLCFAPQWVSGVHDPPRAMCFHLSLCSVWIPFLCASLRYCHLCHSNWGFFNWVADKQQQSSEALREGSQHLLWLREEICKELQGGCQAIRPWESHYGKGGTREEKSRELATFPCRTHAKCW